MAKRIKCLSAIMILACAMSFGIWIVGYSQEPSNTPAGTVVQQQPTTQQPYTNPRMKRRGLIVIADLNVTPITYAGLCPAVFTLKGQIYANRAMTVLYKIIRSDNVPMEPIALDFEKEERKEITYTWQIGNPAKPAAFNEWALIEAVYPLNTKIRSNVAFLKGSCGNQADSRQEDVRGQQERQKVQLTAPTGLPGSQPPGGGSMPPGSPMNPPGQQKQPTASVFPMMPPGQGGQAPSGLPMPQPGQTEQMPSGMPVVQPGHAGPMPSSFPIPPPNQPGQIPGGMPVTQPGQTGPMPGSIPIPPPDVKTLPET